MSIEPTARFLQMIGTGMPASRSAPAMGSSSSNSKYTIMGRTSRRPGSSIVVGDKKLSMSHYSKMLLMGYTDCPTVEAQVLDVFCVHNALKMLDCNVSFSLVVM